MKTKYEYLEQFNQNRKQFRDIKQSNYGITIDYLFLVKLIDGQMLTSNHLLFFSNIFMSIYQKHCKILCTDCYFFSDFIPSLTIQLPDCLIKNEIPKKQSVKPNIKIISQIDDQSTNNYNKQNDNKVDKQQSQIKKNCQIISIENNIDQQFQAQNKNNQYNQYNQQIGQAQQLSQQNRQNYEYSNQFSKINPKQPFNSIITEVNSIEANQSSGNKQSSINSKYQVQQTNISSQTKERPQTREQQETTKQLINKDLDEQMKKYNIQIKQINIIPQEQGTFKMNRLKDLIQNLREIHKIQEPHPFDPFDYIFFPINIMNDHWVSAIVFQKRQLIQIIDSLGKSYDIIEQGLKLALNTDRKQVQWKIIYNSPLQKNSFDCGLFCLKALIYLIKNSNPVNSMSYDQNTINQFRFQLMEIAVRSLSQKLTENLIDNILNQ